MAETEKKEITYKEIYSRIKKQNGIADIWEKVLVFIKESFDSSDTENADTILKFFCIYFSLIDDGNTCVCLDDNILLDKWMEKWTGLILVSEKEQGKAEAEADKKEFQEIIQKGIEIIKNKKCSQITGEAEDNKLFVTKQIEGGIWLFANKYFKAKTVIEDRISKLFPLPAESVDVDFSNIKPKYELAEEQKEIIRRGIKNNLIVTGGPGTGKTTSVYYLLWKLLERKGDACDPYYKLYLAAPSGKAKDRLKESITKALNEDAPEDEKIKEMLTAAEAQTIHGLLSYNPGKNRFYYNSENQFDKNSIFVIDEASMIDIMLFKSLLEAIPDGARLFILGDKDQLPSVQAGAVFEELVTKRKDCLAELKITHRFKEGSEVFELKKEFQNENPFPKDRKDWKKYGTWLDSYSEFDFEKDSGKDNPVFLYELKEPEKREKDKRKKEQLFEILRKWSRVFCEGIAGEAVFEDMNDAKNKITDLHKLSDKAKILCAERQGFRGVEEINRNISRIVCKHCKDKACRDDEGYYYGQPLIITQNMRMFNLYNGDTGVVVGFEDKNTKYLMVEKKSLEEDSSDVSELFFRIGDFMFYSLSLLPKDSIETAYAITIHKSQGSGYPNIMVILPEKPGHPLLNRQIIYTAVTRTEGNTYVIASIDALNHAKKTLIMRDTKLEIGNVSQSGIPANEKKNAASYGK